MSLKSSLKEKALEYVQHIIDKELDNLKHMPLDLKEALVERYSWRFPLQIRTFRGCSFKNIQALNFCPSTYKLAIISRAGVNILDIMHETTPTFVPLVGTVKQAVFSSGGAYIAIATYLNTSVWDVKNALLKVFERPLESSTIAWLTNSHLALCLGDKVHIWDIQMDKRLYSISHQLKAAPFYMSVSQKGDYFALSSGIDHTDLYKFDRERKLWTFDKKLVPHEVTVFIGAWGANTTAFSSDGKFIACGCVNEGQCACVYLFDIEKGLCVHRLKHEIASDNIQNMNAICYSSEGSYLVTACTQNVCLWDIAKKDSIIIFKRCYYGTFSSDGKYLALAHEDGRVSIWANGSFDQMICHFALIKVEHDKSLESFEKVVRSTVWQSLDSKDLVTQALSKKAENIRTMLISESSL